MSSVTQLNKDVRSTVPISTTTSAGSRACTCDNTTDTITSATHGFSNGDRVAFFATTMPSGMPAGYMFYVINKTDDTFQISTTSGGGAYDFTSNGVAVYVANVVTLWSIVVPVQSVLAVDWNIEHKTGTTTNRRGNFTGANNVWIRTAGNVTAPTISQTKWRSDADFDIVTGIDIGTQTAIVGAYGVNGLTNNWFGNISYKMLTN